MIFLQKQGFCKNAKSLFFICLATATVVVITAATEDKDYKNDNPETVIIAEATIVSSKATHTYTSFLSNPI